jgi:hypothetical protein
MLFIMCIKNANLLSVLSQAIVQLKISEHYCVFTQTWVEKFESCGKTLIQIETKYLLPFHTLIETSAVRSKALILHKRSL